MTWRIEGKRILITGASAGIGRATALALAERGAVVTITSRDATRGAEAARTLSRQSGQEVDSLVLDLSDLRKVAETAETFAARAGKLDVLINNAGIATGRAPMVDVPLEDLHRLMNVNFFGVWHGAAIFGKRMIAQGEPAAIYNLASENAFFNAVQNSAPYIASKHAVRGLTEAMRDEFPDHIQVGMIVPGFVASDMTKGVQQFAMDADTFAEKVVEQIRAGEFYVVTHAYNIVRIKPIHEEIEDAYQRNAPRYEGDDEYDVPTLIARLTAGRDGS